MSSQKNDSKISHIKTIYNTVYIMSFYIIKQGNKAVGIVGDEKSYIIGFKKSVQARHVQYVMHPERTPIITRSDKTSMLRVLTFDPAAVIRFEKCNDTSESGFHLMTLKFDELLKIPLTQQVGLVIPNNIIEETDKYIEFTCDLIDPYFDHDIYKSSLIKDS